MHKDEQQGTTIGVGRYSATRSIRPDEVARVNTTHATKTERTQQQPARAGRLTAYTRLVRAENCLLAAGLTAIGAETAHRRFSGDFLEDVLAACLIVALVVAAGNAVNDLCDRDIDRLRRPTRPLPSGALGVKDAVRVALISAGGAIGLAVILGVSAATFVAFMVLLATLYSTTFKKVPLIGNFGVAIQCALTVVFGCAVVGGFTARTWHIGAIVLAGMLSFEVAKTIEDEVADNLVGNFRTIASVLDQRWQRTLMIAITVGAIAVTVVPLPSVGALWICFLIALPVIPLGIAARWRSKDTLSLVLPPFIAVSKLFWIASLIGLAVLAR